MVSLLLPAELRLKLAPGLLVIRGPFGTARISLGTTSLRLIETLNGRRLVAQESVGSTVSATTLLAYISRRMVGVTVGIRRRLRLFGVGFRATLEDTSKSDPKLALKLGFREERRIPLAPLAAVGVHRTAARLEGRSKGSLIRVEGPSRERVHQAASDLRDLRRPDSYKGKGVQYDQERLVLKKGKREL